MRISWKTRTYEKISKSWKLSMLETGLNNDISKTALKNMIEKKKLKIFNFLGEFSRKKSIKLSKTNEHSEECQPTTWKQLFVYPVGLTKTL